MKRIKTGKRFSVRRIAAMFLAVLMVLTAADLGGVIQVRAAEGSSVKTITAFAALADDVKEQTVAVGATEEELNLPDTLSVTVRVEAPTPIENVEAEPATTEETATEETTTEVLTPTEGVETEATATEEITIDHITWRLDTEESDFAEFDSSIDGAGYVYHAVLPETDSQGNKLVLADGVSLPMITVLVGERGIQMMSAAPTGSKDVSQGYIEINSRNLNTYNNQVLTGSKAGITQSEMKNGANAFQYAWLIIDGVTVNLTLQSVTIGYEANVAAPFSGILLKNGATLNLTLTGDNSLSGIYGGCGINVPGGCTLNITAESTGRLTAVGGDGYGGGAGIGALGSGYNFSGVSEITQTCGTIRIAGGTVNAIGGTQYDRGSVVGGAAGIGGSVSAAANSIASTGRIEITGGTVNAQGGGGAAGIGGGMAGYVEQITIAGGTVTATSDDSAAAIGAGYNAFANSSGKVSCGTIIISEGTVTANGNIGYGDAYAAGGNQGGSVTVSGGSVELVGGIIDADTKSVGDFILYSYTIQFVIYDETITGGEAERPVITIGSGTNAYRNDSAQWTYEPGKATATISFKSFLHGEQTATASFGSKTYDSTTITLESENKVGWGSTSNMEVSNVSGCTYTYTGGRLVFSGSGVATVSMAEGVTETSERITFADNSSITLTIRDLNINTSEENAIQMADNAGNCTIDIEGNNTLSSGTEYKAVIRAGNKGSLTFQGNGTLNVNHTADYYGVGIGGNGDQKSNVTLIFNGNPFINVTCKEESVCIGTMYSYSNAATEQSSSGITVNSGTITVKNRASSYGIGGASTQKTENYTKFNGGTVYAEGGYRVPEAGGLINQYTNVTISGGSLRNNDKLSGANANADAQTDIQPKDSSGVLLYMSTITVGPLNYLSTDARVSSLSIVTAEGSEYAYGTDGMYTDEAGKLYLWLPAGAKVSQVITENGTFIGTCTTTATKTVTGAIYGTNETSIFSINTTFFTPVKDITLPESYAPKAGETDLSSAGTVSPDNASNKTITWSVVDAGATGAVIDGNTLTLKDKGTYTLRATVANGATATTDFTKDFTFTLSELPVTITGQGAGDAEYGYSTVAEAPYVYVNAVATDSNDALSYQWYSVGTGASGEDEALSEGRDRAYTLPTGKGVNNYSYYCKVTCHGFTVKSTTVTAKVTKASLSADEVTLTAGGTYGQSLNSMTPSVSGTVKNASGTVVTGAWAFAAAQTVNGASADSSSIYPAAGDSTLYTAVFTPDNSNSYNTVTKQVSVTVGQRELTAAGVTIGTVTDTITYDGNAKTPTVSIADIGAAITPSDYQYGYTHNTDAGTATITITGKGNYKGTVTRTFTIAQAAGSITINTPLYNKTYKDADFPLDTTIVGDGTVTYGSSNEAVAAVDTNGTVTIKKPGTATITVSLAAGTNYTGAGNQTVTVNVAKKTSDPVADINRTYVYTAGSKGNTVPIDIAGYLPNDRGETTYNLAANDASYVTDKSVDANGNLTYKVNTTGSAGDTTSLIVTATSENYKDITVTIKIKLEDKLQPELQSGSAVSLNGGSAYVYGASLKSKTFNSAVFVEQGTSNVVTGSLEFTTPDAVPTVGTIKAGWTFTPDEGSTYSTVTGEVSISVSKATPTVTTPTGTGVTYDPNKNLSTVTLNGTNGSYTVGGSEVSVEGTWSWKTETAVPVVDNNEYTAVFTPSGAFADNYETVEKTVTVAVSKATPVVDVLPSASAITYGQTLGNSNLTDGTAKYSSTNNAAVAGSYAWKVSTTKPTVADSGVTEYGVTFTPSETANYNSFTAKVTLIVKKATNAPNMPGSTMAPKHSLETVGAVTLPADWIWDTSDAAKILSDGVAVTATAIYNGTDKGNYEKESVEITLTRVDCDHTNTEIRGAVAATCKAEGYTGDTYCKDCGTLILSGTTIKALGHTGGTAACKEQAVCTRCGEHYGALNPGNHIHSEIRNAKAATCTTEGYTGDKYCSDCGTKLSSGTTTTALGHDYVGQITTQPTTMAEGVRTYICSRCGDTYTESIPKLPENHNHSYTGSITKQPTCTEAGIWTFTCTCGDTYTESIPALGHQFTSRVTRQPATTSEGVMTYTCGRCGLQYTRAIARLEQSSTEQTGKPFIEDAGKEDAGKEGAASESGWDAITDQTEKARDGDTIKVDMNGGSVVPGDVLDSVKGKDVTIVFDMGNGMTWSVNGKDITSDKVGDIDFAVTTDSSVIPVDVVNNITGEKYSINISLAYDGDFGFTAVLTVNMDKKNAGLFANLFYYNKQTGEMEFICADEIGTDGSTELTFTHASEYTIVVDEKPMNENIDESESTETGAGGATGDAAETMTSAKENAWNPVWIIVIGLIVLVAGLGVFFAVRKKKEKEE